ncbi:MAG: DnaJ domain-containing protein [Acidobacteriota bacterium]
MSSAAAGKFQDHYEVLAVDPRAGSDAVQQASSQLSQKYHPSNKLTGDKEKFEAVTLAFEVLSDPLLRKEFDKLKGIGDDGPPTFSGPGFFDILGRDNGLRAAMLSVLYERRRRKPFTPSLSMRHLEGILAATEVELNFTLWYLKQRSLIQMDDKSSLQITIDGMDFLEMNQPTAAMVMPFIKPAAVKSDDAQANGEFPTAAALSDASPAEVSSSIDGTKAEPKPITAAQRIMAARRLQRQA